MLATEQVQLVFITIEVKQIKLQQELQTANINLLPKLAMHIQKVNLKNCII